MKLSIVIPCYNEKDNIEKLKAEFFPVVEKLVGGQLPDGKQIDSAEVIFVDDGSMDDTFNALKNALQAYKYSGVSIIFRRHEINRGLGAALRTGFNIVTGDVVVTTDSDGTYHFSTIPAMLEHMEENSHLSQPRLFAVI